LLASGEI